MLGKPINRLEWSQINVSLKNITKIDVSNFSNALVLSDTRLNSVNIILFFAYIEKKYN